MGVVFRWGVDRGFLAHNPAAGIAKLERPKKLADANRPWSDEKREAVLTAAPPPIRACVALGMFAGCREADAVGMTWESVGKDGWLRWKMQKTGDQIAIPIDPRLAAILDEVKGGIIPHPSLRIVVGMRSGEPYTMDGFRAIFFRLIRKLEREGKVRDGLTFHGLRHTLGARLASLGASTKMIQTLLGHHTAPMAEHYSRAYDKRTLAQAAMTLISGNVDSNVYGQEPRPKEPLND